MQCGKISVAVEGVEMRTECSVLPDAFGWFACSALFRFRFDGYDVKLVFLALEWFVCKQGISGSLCILQEQSHLFLSVAFCQIGNVDAVCCVGCLLECYERGGALALVPYQDIAGHDLMSKRTHDFSAIVAQVDGDVYRVFGHGY